MSQSAKSISNKKRQQYLWTPEMDSLLDEGYKRGPVGRGFAINKIHLLTGWPRQACWDRARKLGLTHKRGSLPRRWSKAEDQYLIRLVGNKNIRLIAQRLNRSVSAIRTRLNRMRDCAARVRNGHTKSELAELLGRSPKTIQQWIDCGWLKGRYEGKQRADDAFRISDESFLNFWLKHPEEVPFHRWSREGLEWILALMADFPTAQTPGDNQMRQERRQGKEKTRSFSLPASL